MKSCMNCFYRKKEANKYICNFPVPPWCKELFQEYREIRLHNYAETCEQYKQDFWRE